MARRAPWPSSVGNMFDGRKSRSISSAHRFPERDPALPVLQPILDEKSIVPGCVSFASGSSTPQTADSLVSIAMDLASGRLGNSNQRQQRRNVVIVTWRHYADELAERVERLSLSHQVDPRLVENRLLAADDLEQQWATLPLAGDNDIVAFPNDRAVRQTIQEHEADVFILNAFADLVSLAEPLPSRYWHALEAWRTIARETGTAVLLVQYLWSTSVPEPFLEVTLDRPFTAGYG